MDFEPTERQVYWRNRVRDFIETNVRPRHKDYKAEQASGGRWKVLQVVEEEKAKAKAAGIWNLFMPPRNAGHHHVEDTFEFDIGLYMKRERALTEFMGDANYHAERVAQLSGY